MEVHWSVGHLLDTPRLFHTIAEWAPEYIAEWAPEYIAEWAPGYIAE